MIPINPFTLGAASIGVSKLAHAARPIADFALRGFRSTRPAEQSAEQTRLGPREQLANDAQGALLDFARQLEDKLAELGVTLGSPVQLQRSPSGRYEVANSHAHKESLQDLFSSM